MVAIPPLRRGEEGFALITAVWLLVLCGAIGALVMLRSLSAAKTAKEQGDSLQHTILLESAVETVMAERMFGGPKSKWWALPASGSVAIGGHEVRVELTSEAGRANRGRADDCGAGRGDCGDAVGSWGRVVQR